MSLVDHKHNIAAAMACFDLISFGSEYTPYLFKYIN